MNAVGDGVKVIACLVGLGQEFAFINDSEFSSREYLAASLTGMAADGTAAVRMTGAMLANVRRAREMAEYAAAVRGGWLEYGFPQGEDDALIGSRERQIATEKKRGQGASIISWAITIVEGLELLTGFGPPYRGGTLGTGSKVFAILEEPLRSALPDFGWQGLSSQVYVERNAELRSLVDTLADLDLELAALVNGHAESVTHIRLGFGVLKDVLIAALVIEYALRSSISGLALCKLIASLGVLAATVMVAALCLISVQHAKQVDVVADQYAPENPKLGVGQSGRVGPQGDESPSEHPDWCLYYRANTQEQRTFRIK